MLDIKKIPVNMLEENCYVVSDALVPQAMDL